MRNSTDESPIDRGEVQLPGRCQICGAEGRTIAAPGEPPPNALCERCAIEYAEAEEDEPASN
jgi:hypothetical protein